MSYHLSSKELKAQSTKKGTWQHLCAKGRFILERGAWQAMRKSMTSQEGLAALKVMVSYFGGLIDHERFYLHVDVSQNSEAMQPFLHIFPVPEEYKVRELLEYNMFANTFTSILC